MKGGIMSENQMAKTMSLTAIKKRMLEEIRTSKEILELSSNLLKQKAKANSMSMSGMSEEITTNKELLNILKKKTLKPDTPPASITYEMLLNEDLEEDMITNKP